ncbi:ATP-binding protein [Enterobacter roggenkampii]|uniref:AAA family ATPase n=1 Tax=Enterobacter roggenkampii TaxID=1812935 RepID=UPI0009C258B4|nr:ATP-binding protein [Enterobacter roggenkampii]AQT88740.1 hypothetical protein B1H21_09260 [Enterobacter roggenkampii]ASG38004.1 hypothetical protein CES92_03115 [Enterobacter roggenkampii]EMF0891697.1 AAA family ATPase [Enterobacter roggenkampii]MCK7252819.1 ATP-binding protein [Enterobacter roggenkampii]MDK4549052.1 ATP-binding protein [Enterobacter roggenkampii]
MKIVSIAVVGLFGKPGEVVYNFHEDLNIITGRNGSGKTTLLKLAWFIISGNILYALKEVDFKSCIVTTSEYKCTVIRTGDVYCRIEINTDYETYVFEDDEFGFEGEPFGDSAEDKAARYLIPNGSSIFFPTFRRIEGGFSSDSKNRNRPFGQAESEIDKALSSLSKRMTNNEHLFIAAISSQDINGVLLRKYALLSEEINAFQADISRTVIDKIKKHQQSQNSLRDADALLAETRSDIEQIEEFRTQSMRPLDAVKNIVEKLFQHAGISFGKRLSFGDAAEAVNSEVLSAGEKQMLSFICYNAFHKNAVIFIDEPELSLHVDWQRQLYKILSEQNPTNQFIFATHSPFIYGKFPDKEVSVGIDRGE